MRRLRSSLLSSALDLARRFAVTRLNAGHTGAPITAFGFEPLTRLDYGYQAVGELTPMAKDLLKTAYAKGPDRSYIGLIARGSTIEEMAASQRTEFDRWGPLDKKSALPLSLDNGTT